MGTERARNCSRVVGARSGPALATIAARPWLNRPWKRAMDGCRPKVRPGVFETDSGRRLPASSARAGVRPVAYCRYSEAPVGTTMLLPSLPPKRKMHTSAR